MGGALAGAVLCALAVILAASGAPAHERFQRALVEGLIVGVPVLVGVYAARSPRDARFGRLLVGAGVIWSLSALAQSSDSLPYSVGRVAAWLIFPLLLYLMLAFPAGRLAGFDRTLFACGALLIAVLFIGSAPFVQAYPTHTPWASCLARCPPNAFFVLDREPGVMRQVVEPLRELLGVLVLAAVGHSLVTRAHTASRLGRRLVVPVAAMSVVSIAVLVAFLVTRLAGLGGTGVETLGLVWALCVPAIAAAFLLGLIRRGLLAGEVLERLSGELNRDLDQSGLRAALMRALDDPTVDLLLPDASPGRWRDARGRVTSTAAAASYGQAVTTIDEAGVPVAAMVHDAALREDDELLGAIGSLVGTALRHERLEARLSSSLSQLEASRRRVARVADVERARIERDLHDGAQQRLVVLRLRLSLAEERMQEDPIGGGDAVRELGGELELAIDELRAVAHGVYPSLLHDRGLEHALRSAVDTSPVAVELEARGLTRHAPELEAAVYFACLEALQNAYKHARGATKLRVSLRQHAALEFEVHDDGAGFLLPPGEFKGGLRNMRDRIEAIGGVLTVDSSPGNGTRVRGSVPLS